MDKFAGWACLFCIIILVSSEEWTAAGWAFIAAANFFRIHQLNRELLDL